MHGRRVFAFLKSLLRLDRPLARLAAGLNPEPLNPELLNPARLSSSQAEPLNAYSPLLDIHHRVQPASQTGKGANLSDGQQGAGGIWFGTGTGFMAQD